MNFDPPTLINWVVAGAIAFVFTYLAHFLESRREQDQYKERFRHERDDAIRHEVLPETRRLMHVALDEYAKIGPGVARYPDFNTATQAAIDEILDKSPLAGSQKQQVREAQNMNFAYGQLIFWYELRDVENALRVYRDYSVAKKIYIDDGLYGLFDQVLTLTNEALRAAEVVHTDKVAPDRARSAGAIYTGFARQVEPLVKQIEQLVTQLLKS